MESSPFKNRNLRKATVIVLLGQFKDLGFGKDLTRVERALTKKGAPLDVAKSLFYESSGDKKFDLDFVFVEQFFDSDKNLIHFISQPNPEGLYPAETEFGSEIVRKAHNAITKIIGDLNLSPIFLLVVHPAKDGEKDGLYSIKSEAEVCGDLYDYVLCSSESLTGTFCHEIGHLLFDWPDLYDSTDLDENGHQIDGISSGLGDWCLMAKGISQDSEKFVGPCGWIKYCQKWAEAGVIAPKRGKKHTLEPGKMARIDIAEDDEFLLLENRGKSGIDSDAWGEGLLIYHVDAVALKENESFPNSDELLPGVKIYQGDGFSDLLLGRHGDAADPYPSVFNNDSTKRVFNDSLTDYTIPRANRSNGDLSGVRIENIKQDQTNGNISFEYRQHSDPSASQIIDVEGTTTDLINGPGSYAIAATKIKQDGMNRDWLVTAELTSNICLYQIDDQGNATKKVFEVDSFSKFVQLQSFSIANKSYVLVYDPYTAKTLILELKNGTFKKAQDLKPDQTRYRRYMMVNTGEFLTSGELNLVGLDPFKNILDFYRIETDLKLTWLESQDVYQQVRGDVSWSEMVSGKFGGNNGLDDLCLYDRKHHEVVFLQTKPFSELSSETFNRSDSNTPLRYDRLCSGKFFPASEHGLALFSSDKGLESIWFRNTANPNYDNLWTLPEDWSLMVSGDFFGIGSDQMLLHRR